MNPTPSSRPLIFVTPGDPDGIGPEVVLKAARRMKKKWASFSLVCVGAEKPFARLGARLRDFSSFGRSDKIKRPFDFYFIPAPKVAARGLLLEGYQSGWAIEVATRLVQKTPGSALVTGPIHKGRLNRGGYHYSGHTEFLSHLCGNAPVTMMLANKHLRVSLVTTHIALNSVSKKLTRKKIIDTIDRTHAFLFHRCGIKKPRIAVCSLNPHAGEGGLFGFEDQKTVGPALFASKKKLKEKVVLSGPHPSDTFFANHVTTPPRDRADAVICMYHDQGLIPVKLVDFANTVNITLGLPIIRTSVDHGTAFDIAWKNRADPSSFIAAVDVAVKAVRAERRSKRKRSK